MTIQLVQKWIASDAITSGAFRTPGAPLYPDSIDLFSLAPDDRHGYGDLSGNLTGDFTGTIDTVSGVIKFTAATPIKPAQIKCNGVSYTFVPTDPALLGIDASRLPPNGRVPIFWPGCRILVHSTQQDTFPSPLSAGQQVQLSRINLAYARLYDQAGTRVATAKYSVVLGTGLVTLANPLDLSAYQQPLICEHRIQDLCSVSDVDLSGRIRFIPALSHAYDADDTYVSTVLGFGTKQALAYPVYDGATWQSVWSDTLVGDEPLAEYDTVNYPIQVDNESAVGDQFICLFRTSQAFDFIGRNRGIIASGRITEDFEPINSLTGLHYLKIRKEGWGAGWSVGNYLYIRINPASNGLWAIRTILPNRSAALQDQIKIEFWGNASV